MSRSHGRIRDRGSILINCGLLICAFVVGCRGEKDVVETSIQTLEARLVDSLILGVNEERGADYIFGRVGPVVADTGLIFVADLMASHVKVFDRTGRHIVNLGRRGDGPGELDQIRSMALDEDGNLVVASRTRFTRFSRKGDVEDVVSVPSRYSPRVFAQGRDGGYLSVNPSESGVFYRVSADLVVDTVAGGRLMDFGVSEKSVEGLAITRAYSGSASLLADGTLLYAPPVYSGKIVRYVYDNGKWRVDGHISGHVERDPYRKVEIRGWDYMDLQMSRVDGPPMALLVHNQTRGIFAKHDGTMLHFTWCDFERDDVRVFGVEIYDSTGQIVGYAPLENVPLRVPGGAPVRLAPDVRYLDSDGNLFYVRADSVQTVHMANLVLSDERSV